MKACPGLRSGIDSRHSSRHWYEKALKRLSSAPTNPTIRHSREGGNPRTNIPRKNVNRDTTTYVHTATPLRLSGESTPEPRYGAGIQRGVGGANFHTLVCRRQPGWAIGTKMMLRGFESASESQKSSGSSFRRRPESRRGGDGEM